MGKQFHSKRIFNFPTAFRRVADFETSLNSISKKHSSFYKQNFTSVIQIWTVEIVSFFGRVFTWLSFKPIYKSTRRWKSIFLEIQWKQHSKRYLSYVLKKHIYSQLTLKNSVWFSSNFDKCYFSATSKMFACLLKCWELPHKHNIKKAWWLTRDHFLKGYLLFVSVYLIWILF